MIKLPLLCLILPIVCWTCPVGFELVSNGECRGFYATLTTARNQVTETAIANCAQVQTQPVMIHNSEQQAYWTAQFPTLGRIPLGLVCNLTSYQWQWADGSALDYKPPSYDDAFYNCQSGCGAYITNETGHWALVESSDGCESFADDSEDGICYQVGAAAESFQDAQMTCLKLGANLASIHSLQENSFVRRLAVSKGAVNGLLLGATMSGKGNKFGWVDGSSWDYENFHAGFPMPGVGDCLAMDTSTSAGLWMNLDFSEELPIACARDQRSVAEPTCIDGPWAENTIITSPGFPYNASIPCEYFLAVEEGKRVELEVVLVQANTCCDSLTLYDQFLGGHVIAKLTGEKRNVTFTSSSNNMRVVWQPNDGLNVEGMAMTYRAV